MRQYAAKRVALFIPTVLLITITVFVVMRLVPGDPAIAIIEAGGGGNYTQEDLDNLRQKLGAGRGLFQKYFEWIGGIFKGDFGDSLKFNAPVITELKNRIAVTIASRSPLSWLSLPPSWRCWWRCPLGSCRR